MKKKDPLLTRDDCTSRHRYKYGDFYCCSRCHGKTTKKRPNRRMRHLVKNLLRTGRWE